MHAHDNSFLGHGLDLHLLSNRLLVPSRQRGAELVSTHVLKLNIFFFESKTYPSGNMPYISVSFYERRRNKTSTIISNSFNVLCTYLSVNYTLIRKFLQKKEDVFVSSNHAYTYLN
jgi:hypothetical protein